VRLGETDDDSDNETERLEKIGAKVWDSDPIDPVRGWRPQKVRVRFQRAPLPTDGSSPYYVVDVTLTSTTGVVSGSYVQLDDDLSALGATGTPSNSAACSTRATERANDWLRKRQYADAPKLISYENFQKNIDKLFGSTRTRFIFDERGASRTELISEPDGALEKWKPLTGVPKWWPPGGGTGSSLLDCSPLASLEPTACLSMTVRPTPAGRCEDVDPDQIVILDDGDEDGTWTGDVQFVTDTGSYDVAYSWPSGDAVPTLTIGAVSLRFLGCFNGKFQFLGYGTTLCAALSDGVCADNSFIVELECITCPNPDYAGPGWYCRSTTGCGGGDVQTCVYYASDPGPGVTLCSGPHADEATCEGVCNESGTSHIDCGGGEVYDIKSTLIATFTGATGELAPLLGTAIPLTYSSGPDKWEGTVTVPGMGCDYTVQLTPCDGLSTMSLKWGPASGLGAGKPTIFTNPPFATVFTQTYPGCAFCDGVLCGGTAPVATSNIEITITE
jgi:hypothetical protein